MTGSVPPPGGDPRYGGGQPRPPAPAANSGPASPTQAAGPTQAAAPAPVNDSAADRIDASTAGTPAGRDPDRLSNALLRVVAVLAVLLIAVVVNSLFHGGEEGGGVNPVAQAAEKTQRQPGARFSVEATYSSPVTGKEVTATGEGVYEARHRRSDLRMEVGTVEMETLGDEQNMYFRIEGQDEHLPPGKIWVGVEPFLGHSAEEALATGGGFESRMQLLEAAGGKVESLGEEEVRGVLTHRYSVEVDPARVADTLQSQGNPDSARLYGHITESFEGPIESEVWIDDSGLMRRMSEVMTLKVNPSKPPIRIDMKMDLFDFGHRSHVPLPKPSEVLDLTPLVKAEQHLTDGTAFGPLRPPAGAAPLSPAEFRERTRGACESVQADAKRISRKYVPQVRAMKRLGEEIRDGLSPQEALPRIRHYIGATFPAYEGMLLRLLHRLAAIAPPAGDAKAFSTLLRNSAKQIEIARGEALGYEIGDLKITSKLKPELQRLSRSNRRLANELKIPHCGLQGGGSGSSLGGAAPNTNSA